MSHLRGTWNAPLPSQWSVSLKTVCNPWASSGWKLWLLMCSSQPGETNDAHIHAPAFSAGLCRSRSPHTYQPDFLHEHWGTTFIFSSSMGVRLMHSGWSPVWKERLTCTPVSSVQSCQKLPKISLYQDFYLISSFNCKILFGSHNSGTPTLFFLQIAFMYFSCLKINWP